MYNDKLIFSDGWFTVEGIDDDTFCISEKKHWQDSHCYLLLGNESALMIDTGLGVKNIREVVEKLTSLPVTVATTHAHWDHTGGHRLFSKIAVHKLEKNWFGEENVFTEEQVRQDIMAYPCKFPKDFKIEDYSVFKGEAQILLEDGYTFDLGGRKIVTVHTPGHSPGHCCFYEEDRGYLYSGDLIYAGPLDMFYRTTDPAAFWESVKKVEKLNVKRILPGHNPLSLTPDIIERIDRAFEELSKKGDLHSLKGIFDFGDFKLHL